MRNRYKYLIIFFFITADIFALFLIYSTSFKINQNVWESLLNPNSEIFNIVVITWFLAALAFKLHSFNKEFILDTFYKSTWLAFISQFLLFYAYVYVNQGVYNFVLNDLNLMIHFSLIVIYMFLSRLCITYLFTNIKLFQKEPFKVAIWGFNLTSIQLASYFEEKASINKFLGIINENEYPIYSNAKEFNNSLQSAINQALKQDIQEMYVVAQPQYLKEMPRHFRIADKNFLRLRFIPDFSMTVPESFIRQNIDNFQIIKAGEEPLEEPANRLKKRIFDVCFSLMVLIFLMSWLFPIIALIIKFQSRGPVLFKQLRTGHNNKEFWCYKFRSMRINGESDQKQAEKNDNRITPIGRFIRRTSIDELPQFFNVLIGDMSVVGPRPHMIKHTEDYNKLIDNFMVRHFVKPGITGLSQISGFRGETKRTIDMQKRVNTDIEYLRNWSLFNDLKICLLTVIITLKGDDKAF
jgi:Undecaprenyl-phosphate glucose phosphotransferase